MKLVLTYWILMNKKGRPEPPCIIICGPCVARFPPGDVHHLNDFRHHDFHGAGCLVVQVYAVPGCDAAGGIGYCAAWCPTRANGLFDKNLSRYAGFRVYVQAYYVSAHICALGDD